MDGKEQQSKVLNLRKTDTEAAEKSKDHIKRRKVLFKWSIRVYICFSDEYAEASGVVLTECWRADRFCWAEYGLLFMEEVTPVTVLGRGGFWTLPADVEERSPRLPFAPLVELNWKYFGSMRELAGGLTELKLNEMKKALAVSSVDYLDSVVSFKSPLLAEWCRTAAEAELFKPVGIWVLLIRCWGCPTVELFQVVPWRERCSSFHLQVLRLMKETSTEEKIRGFRECQEAAPNSHQHLVFFSLTSRHSSSCYSSQSTRDSSSVGSDLNTNL